MIDKSKIEEAVKLLIEGMGEDASREGLVGTPERIGRMYEEIFSGIDLTPEDILSTTFTSNQSEMVIEKDITFYSMCEHHLLPFFGKAHIAYIPNGKVAGLSKLARTVEVYAKRPQIQERLTGQIADAIEHYLDAKGVIVVMEAEHLCMSMRGVNKPGTKTMTIATRGELKQGSEGFQTFMQLIKE